MKVRFYNFSKRKNSTALPSSSYTEKDVLLKNDTSVHDPVLQIAGGPNVSYNYAYIPTFDRYYFVKDYVSVANGLTDYYLSEDVMGSHVSEIAACSCRVAFCTNPYYSTLNDPRIAVHMTKEIHGSTSGQILSSTGCYIFTVLNNESNGVGCATSYALTQAGINKVKEWLADDSVFAGLTTFFQGTPLESVFGCTWIPFSIDSVPGTSVTNLKFGDRTMNGDNFYIATGDAKRVTGFAVISGTANVTCHLRYPVTDFRAVEPYTSGTIYLPGVGNVDLNMSDWITSTKINVSYTFEVVTGNMTYLLFTDNGALVQSATCNIASQCPLGQITMNSNGMVSGIGTVVAGGAALVVSGATGAVGAAAAGAMLSGAANTVLSYNKRAPSVSGAAGGRMAALWPYIDHIEYSVDTEDPEDSSGYIAIKGRPLGEVVTISSCNGYIECDGASVNISGSDLERDEINAIMNSGFYFE